MSKKILLTGNPQSPYIIQYIENVLEPLGFDIYMQLDPEKYDAKVFSGHNVHLIKYYPKDELPVFFVPVLGRLVRFMKSMLLLNESAGFDYVHIQQVNPFDLLRVFFLKKSPGIKMFASFWGSDLLLKAPLYLKAERKFLKAFKAVSADSYIMTERYERIFRNYLKKDLKIIYYGLSLVPYIDASLGCADECRSFFRIPAGKTVIAVAYNSCPQQQHEEVLKALYMLADKSRYHLVFQMTYGHTKEGYVRHIKDLASASGFGYTVIETFLPLKDLAKLRIAADVFINSQTTDAFCNAFKEYMYAKTQVISAGWLHYPEIDRFPLYVSEFSDFDEIPGLLERPLAEEKLEWNRNKIKEKITWEACRARWAEIYDGGDK